MKNMEPIIICETIKYLVDAKEHISTDLTARDDQIETMLKPYDDIDNAIKNMIKLLAYKYDLKVE